jgi:hypothetical protein
MQPNIVATTALGTRNKSDGTVARPSTVAPALYATSAAAATGTSERRPRLVMEHRSSRCGSLLLVFGAQSPEKCGARFSRNALTPSQEVGVLAGLAGDALELAFE